MKRVLSLLVILIMTFAVTAGVYGSTLMIGPRAAALGGAYTAVADDGFAYYWNPAGMTQVKFTLVPSFAVMGNSDIFSDPEGFWKKIDNTINGLEDQENLDIVKYLEDLKVNITINGGLSTAYVGLNLLIDAGLDVQADTNIPLDMDPKEIDYDLWPTLRADADIAADLFAYRILSLAGKIGEKWAVGVNIKAVDGLVGLSDQNYSITPHNLQSSAEASGMAYDLGVLFKVNDQSRLGLIARNIITDIEWKNAETIDYLTDPPTTTKYKPDNAIPQSYALGLAYRPFKNSMIVIDVEQAEAVRLTPEQTRWRFGFEQRVFWNILALRAGAFTNKDEDPSLSGGLGFKWGPLCLNAVYIKSPGNKSNAAYLDFGLKF